MDLIAMVVNPSAPLPSELTIRRAHRLILDYLRQGRPQASIDLMLKNIGFEAVRCGQPKIFAPNDRRMVVRDLL